MKNIIITCDTEVGELAGERKDAFEIFIKGEINGREVGAGLINKIADKFNAKVEHYVDVYPFERYGEAKFKKLCCDILDAGHGVNLHTHPSGKFDKNRKFMWQYSFEEQLQIIKFGKDKIYEWTGVQVISHRAGGYGANDDTLSALYQNEIFIRA